MKTKEGKEEFMKAKMAAYHDLLEEDDFVWEDTFLPDEEVLKMIEDGEDKGISDKDGD